ncbi:hypothetical protein OSSY52_06490 [Tepiditoga spiralis]|uniref:Sulfatase-modifying factor enzyme domain-containing protein n=1 Tax=Tepiditoga spiralis TaxID=2108365 RepID=A0A7G1G2J4_9BACT|nr:SUMF1/EgtB/PvdO family nonheme iron enzyme [Tepiditoga spiralis]BBE30508.1 hypothetical protein OSSY52_06490 [Tepiditoga spiralis]
MKRMRKIILIMIITLIIFQMNGCSAEKEEIKQPKKPPYVKIEGIKSKEQKIDYIYNIKRYEVTFEEYDKYCEETGAEKPKDEGWGRGKRPVINVSWYDAIKYCNWKSEKEGLPKAYDEEGNLLDNYGKETTDPLKAKGYRLPTEAEWEYAARGGKESKGYEYSGSNDIDEVAWYWNNTKETQEVGTKKPNELGIYDMSGNVWEWCTDWYEKDEKVIKGGSWNDEKEILSIDYKNEYEPDIKRSFLGFRVVKVNYYKPKIEEIGDKEINEGKKLEFEVKGTDEDGDELKYEAKGMLEGAKFKGNKFEWRPTYEQSGNYKVIFKVTDGITDVYKKVNIIVKNKNRKPKIKEIGDKEINEGDKIEIEIKGTDEDGDELKYEAKGMPEGAKFKGNKFEWRPTYEQSGKYEVTFKVTDGVIDVYKKVNIIVKNKNTKPKIKEIGDKEINEGDKIEIEIKGTDEDGDELKYEAKGMPEGAKFKGNKFEWKPTYEQSGKYEVTFKVTDGVTDVYKKVNIMVKDKMTYIKKGTFKMGSNNGYSDEKPSHKVELTYKFLIGNYEVTFEEYDKYCEETGVKKPNDEGWGRGKRPVINVIWYDAIKYCNWKSKKEGLPVAYDSNGNLLDENGNKTTDLSKVAGYRLPTEAEWEYAARGGMQSKGNKYAGSNTVGDVAWHSNNSLGKTHEAGTKKSNELGIYDMSGNVWEWCNDWYDENYYTNSPQTNPYNSVESGYKVIRGGSWHTKSKDTKVSSRNKIIKNYKYNDVGFRIVKTGIVISLISPRNYEIVNEDKIKLKWNVVNDDRRKFMYDVYFGTEKENLLKVSEDQKENSYNLGERKEKGIYYWKVKIKSNKGETFETQIYHFYVGGGILKWKYETGNNVYSSPTIGRDGTIYVGSEDGNVYAIKQNGTLKWKYEIKGWFSFKKGVNSSPAIGADGTVYVGSEDGNVYAIKQDGILKWKYKTGGRVNSSPAIGRDGTIYVGSEDGNVYAIKQDGTLKWKYEIKGWFSFKKGVNSSPAIGADGTVYVGSEDGNVYAIKQDGTLKWSYETKGRVNSSPAIGRDRTIYVGSEDGNVYAIKQDGTLKWSYETKGRVNSSPAIGRDRTIYVGSEDGNVYAIKQDGTLKWSYETKGRVNSSPAIGRDRTIYVGSEDGNVYAIKQDGTLKWSYETKGRVNSSSAIGRDGTIYVGSEDGNVYAIKQDGTLKWLYETKGSINSSLTIGEDGMIYVGSADNKVYAITSESKGVAESAWPIFRQNLKHTGRKK